LDTTDHAVPFQCSISVAPLWLPTAHTSFAARATTPFRAANPRPTLGERTSDHLAPSQCWINGMPAWLLLLCPNPTAHTSFEATPSTASSSFASCPMLRVGTIDQVEPFQCRAMLFSEP